MAARRRGRDWPDVRLHVVTGKGGTGKTTVAAALALALAMGGGRTLLVEVEGRQGIAQLFDTPPLPYEERLVALARDGGEVYALAIDPREALMEYLTMYYHAGPAGRALERLGAVDFATTIAPGLRDVLLTGKAYEAVRRRSRDGGEGQPVYDAVVMDAPPTGRIVPFLDVNTQVAGLARSGPIHRQAESIMALIRSPRTAVHVVSTLEEMPAQETADGVGALGAAGLPVGAVVVNMVRRSPLRGRDLSAAARGELDPAEVAAALEAVSLPPRWADALLEEATRQARRVRMERRVRADLAALHRPLYELPLVQGGVDLGALYDMADQLAGQGAA